MAEKEKEKSIYEMALHDTITFKNSVGGPVEVTRVAGGWVYAFDYPAFRQSQITFVPFSNEFDLNTV